MGRVFTSSSLWARLRVQGAPPPLVRTQSRRIKAHPRGRCGLCHLREDPPPDEAHSEALGTGLRHTGSDTVQPRTASVTTRFLVGLMVLSTQACRSAPFLTSPSHRACLCRAGCLACAVGLADGSPPPVTAGGERRLGLFSRSGPDRWLGSG